MRITLKDLLTLKEDGGMTLENGSRVTYKRGYQVATEGKETRSAKIALKYIEEYNGNCGIWYSKRVFYIDCSHYISNKKDAIRIGKAHNQLAIYNWKTGECLYL